MTRMLHLKEVSVEILAVLAEYIREQIDFLPEAAGDRLDIPIQIARILGFIIPEERTRIIRSLKKAEPELAADVEKYLEKEQG